MGAAIRPPIEPIITIRASAPCPLDVRSAGSIAWVTASCPIRLTSIWRRNTSIGMCSSGAAPPGAAPPPPAGPPPGGGAAGGGPQKRPAVTGGPRAQRREAPPMQRWRRKTRLDAHRADRDDLLAILATRRHTDESLCH